MNPSQDNSFGSFGNNFVSQGAISSGGDVVLASGGGEEETLADSSIGFFDISDCGGGGRVCIFGAV